MCETFKLFNQNEAHIEDKAHIEDSHDIVVYFPCGVEKESSLKRKKNITHLLSNFLFFL